MRWTMRLGARHGARTGVCAALAGVLAAGAFGGVAAAQGVDRYEFQQVREQLQALEGDVSQLRGAIGGGAASSRLDAVEDEMKRIIGQVERLEHAQRQHEAAVKQKLTDLEYRIIELEGGDPSILFESQEQPAPVPQTQQQTGQAAPEPKGGTLGVITSSAPVAGDERAALEAGAEAARQHRTAEAKQLLEAFLTDYPGSPLTGDAHYWLGEAYYSDGAYQTAAQRYLDGATLNPGSPLAPESLLKLGVTLGLLGKTDVACSTLREVRGRYPQETEVAKRAADEARRIGCG
ncbi:tol-pal system protein YbgF [Pikeienuella piscinae]|uniref:Cell division coordinator CpoB n=1 Tax=Pikeienuella piscinae TaxID=2748098 RepID=A0A7L5BVA7_9RHOB|nr:tol-pal system protein YbgF [Pikeienuella piscinae]QIE55301.1 tol-pal system protein YbgF [Pikeienuella piscinae]